MGNQTSRPGPALAPAALDALISHDWPGNVRELRNAIQRAVVMAERGELSGQDFSFLRRAAKPGAETESPSGLSRWEKAERTNILGELARQMGNKTKTARELGIAKSTLFEKLKKYGIRTAEFDR
jgi:two-component system response regulator HydG